MEENCICQTDPQACCACVSIHCDTCHKPKQSKFLQGRFCSNCGRPLRAGVSAYVIKSDLAREIFEELEKHTSQGGGLGIIPLRKINELKNKYIGEQPDGSTKGTQRTNERR